jgi:hypothetical protein
MTDAPTLFVDLSCENIAYLGQHRLAGPDTRNLQMASLNALANLGAPGHAEVVFRRQSCVVRRVRLDHGRKTSVRAPDRRVAS